MRRNRGRYGGKSGAHRAGMWQMCDLGKFGLKSTLPPARIQRITAIFGQSVFVGQATWGNGWDQAATRSLRTSTGRRRRVVRVE